MPITKRRRHQRGVKKSRRVKKVRRSRKGRKSIGHRTRKMNRGGGFFSSKSSRMTETEKPKTGNELYTLIYTGDEFTIPYFNVSFEVFQNKLLNLKYSDERIRQLLNNEDIKKLNDGSRTNRFNILIELLDARIREKRTTASSRFQ